MPGCTKRYTDPSSLRKHVKNHSVSRNKRKHRKDEPLSISQIPQPISLPLKLELNNFNEIKCEKSQHIHTVPANATSNSIFVESIAHNKESKTSDDAYDMNTMNLMEISKCILGMENADDDYSFNLEKSTMHKHSTCDNDFNIINGDEFVSIENIKKYLGEQNMDYIDVTLQNHLTTDYFSDFY